MKKHTVSRALLGLAVLSFSFGLVAGLNPTENVSAKKKADKVSVITNIKDETTNPTTTEPGPGDEVTNSGITNVTPTPDQPEEVTPVEPTPEEDPVAPETGIFGGADEEMVAASGLGFAMLVGSIFLLSGGITFAVEMRR